jgi:hypothetical protein
MKNNYELTDKEYYSKLDKKDKSENCKDAIKGIVIIIAFTLIIIGLYFIS